MDENMSDMMQNISKMLNNKDVSDNLKSMLNNFTSNSNNNENPNKQNDIQDNSTDNSNDNNNNNQNNETNESSDNSNPFSNIDFETIMKMKNIFDKVNTKKNDPRANLLLSLKPYLKESRKDKVDKYIQFLNMSQIIEFINPLGGEKSK